MVASLDRATGFKVAYASRSEEEADRGGIGKEVVDDIAEDKTSA